MTIQFNTNQILQRDLEKSAYHESAHLLLLRKFGGDGIIKIKPTHTENLKHEKGFLGCIKLLKLPINLNEQAMIGCAGFIAEQILMGNYCDIDAFDLWLQDYDFLSISDQTLSKNITEESFNKAYSLIHELWSEITKEAEIYIRQNAIHC